MDYLELAKSRYTTKKYNNQKAIPAEKLEQLKEILRLSPSSINSQPWKFIFVTDENMKNKLAPVSRHNEQKVKDASAVVVFSAINDVAKFEQHLKENLPEGPNNYYNKYKKQNSEAENINWLDRQVYISLGFFLSACASMGIDSTAMEGIELEDYTEILGLKDYHTLFAVAIGYRADDDANQPSITPKLRLPLEKVVVTI